MNSILAEMNVPPIHHTTLKEREREAGQAVEEVAQTSCQKAIAEELEMMKER